MTATISAPLKPFNPRLAGAIFFALYNLLLVFFMKYTFLTLRDSILMPLLPSIFFALIIGAISGAIFGKMLAKKTSWLRPFFTGILLSLLTLLLISIVLLGFYYFNENALLATLGQKKAYLLIYMQILIFLSLVVGSWFIPLTGLVAIYFNKQFLPGLIASDQSRLEKKISNSIDNSHDN
ncbi:MAG: hypothetical protein H0U57_01455 [Tatlockia sp.]|nr:hypothetical protein [Tatlockia sp.]